MVLAYSISLYYESLKPYNISAKTLKTVANSKCINKFALWQSPDAHLCNTPVDISKLGLVQKRTECSNTELNANLCLEGWEVGDGEEYVDACVKNNASLPNPCTNDQCNQGTTCQSSNSINNPPQPAFSRWRECIRKIRKSPGNQSWGKAKPNAALPTCQQVTSACGQSGTGGTGGTGSCSVGTCMTPTWKSGVAECRDTYTPVKNSQNNNVWCGTPMTKICCEKSAITAQQQSMDSRSNSNLQLLAQTQSDGQQQQQTQKPFSPLLYWWGQNIPQITNESFYL